MATTNKNFRIKHGLIVEGTSGTISGENILTEGSGDQYIINLIGGSATAENTPSTVVLRDGSGDFAAHDITVNKLNIGAIGNIYDDGDLIIANTDNQDVILQGEDIRLNAQDDVRLTAGVGGDVFIRSDSGQISLIGPSIYAGENLNYTEAEKVATQGYVDDSIANIDLTYTTDDVTEGSNQYFTDARALDAISNNLGTGIVYSAENAGNVFHIDENYLSTEITDGARSAVSVEFGGTPLTYDSQTGVFGIELAADNSIGLDGSNGLKVNRDVVDEWYDASGAAGTAEDNANTYTDGQLNSYTPTSSLDTTVGGYGYLKSADLSTYATQTYADGAADDAESAANTYTNNLIGDVTVDGTAGNTVTDRIESAVANLVNGAPELLDTLNELAAAIGDDDNYATTVSGLIADKQNNLTAGSNIDITSDTISVTGLNTDDVSEGENLYFTDERAIDAVSGADIYPNAVIIDNVAKQVAFTTGNITPAAATTALAWAKADYRSGKFTVKVKNGTHTEISEILVTLDTSDNVAITEYGIVGTNGTLATVTADVSGTDVRVRVTPVNDNSEVMVVGTLLI